MSIAQTGKIISEKQKKKMSKAAKGHVVSEETRRKISETLKKRKNEVIECTK